MAIAITDSDNARETSTLRNNIHEYVRTYILYYCTHIASMHK